MKGVGSGLKQFGVWSHVRLWSIGGVNFNNNPCLICLHADIEDA